MVFFTVLNVFLFMENIFKHFRDVLERVNRRRLIFVADTQFLKFKNTGLKKKLK
jgi:hypothetical protein